MKSGGQIPWNAIAICEMSKISWQTGNLKMNEDLGNHLKDQLSTWCIGWISPKLRERQSKNSSIWKESITKNLSRICFDRGGNLGGNILIADTEELGKLDESEIYPRRLNAKEVLITPKDGEFVCPVHYEFQEPTLRRKFTGRRERISAENLTAMGKSLNLKKMTKKSTKTFGLFEETSCIVIMLKQEFKYTCRKKNHSQFHWSILMQRGQLIQIWMSHKKKEMIHKIYAIERNSSKRIHVVRGETDKKSNDITSRSRMAWRLNENWKRWSSISVSLSWLWADSGRNLERRHSDCRFRRFGKVGRNRNLSSKNQRERSIDNTKRRWIHIPSSRWYSKIVRKRLRIPRTHSQAGTDRGERRFQQRTSRWTERVSTDRINRWRWSPEFNSTCRRKKTFPIPLKYIDVARSTYTDLNVMQEKRVEDYWNVDSNRSPVRFVEKISRSLL